jgi:hypothetical protein
MYLTRHYGVLVITHHLFKLEAAFYLVTAVNVLVKSRCLAYVKLGANGEKASAALRHEYIPYRISPVALINERTLYCRLRQKAQISPGYFIKFRDPHIASSENRIYPDYINTEAALSSRARFFYTGYRHFPKKPLPATKKTLKRSAMPQNEAPRRRITFPFSQ